MFSGKTEYRAQFVIFAAPAFLAPYLVQEMPRLNDFEYSPWLTANLTLDWEHLHHARNPDARYQLDLGRTDTFRTFSAQNNSWVIRFLSRPWHVSSLAGYERFE